MQSHNITHRAYTNNYFYGYIAAVVSAPTPIKAKLQYHLILVVNQLLF